MLPFNADLTPQQYSSPPVREAVFTVSLEQELSLEIVDKFCESPWAKEHYPQTLSVVEVDVHMGETTSTTPITNRTGQRMHTEEAGQKTLLHVTKSQFSFHNFGIYLGWDSACATFLEAWKQFQESTSSAAKVGSIGIRYINELFLPPDAQTKPELYLRLLPNIPTDFPQPVRRFFIQVETVEVNEGLRGIVTETLLPPSSGKALHVLLDVNASISRSTHDKLSINEMLAKTRAFKNRLFESCLTENTRELFNK